MKRIILLLTLGALGNGASSQPVSAVKLLEPIPAGAVSGTSVALVDPAGCRYSGRVGHDEAARTQSGIMVQPDIGWYVVVVNARCAKPALLPGTVIRLPAPPSDEQLGGSRGYRPGAELALTRN